NGLVDAPRNLGIALGQEAIDQSFVKGLYRYLLIADAGEQYLLDTPVSDDFAELEAVHFRHIKINNHHRDIAKPVRVTDFLLDQGQIQTQGAATLLLLPHKGKATLVQRHLNIVVVDEVQGFLGTGEAAIGG